MATAKDTGGFGRGINMNCNFGRGGTAPGGAGRAAGRGRGTAGRGVANSSRGMNQAEVKDAKKAVQARQNYSARTSPDYEPGGRSSRLRGTSASETRSKGTSTQSSNQGLKEKIKSGKVANAKMWGTNSPRQPAAKVKPSSGRMSPRSTGK